MGDWVNLPRVLHLLVPGVAPTAKGRFALTRYVDPPTPSGALPPTAMLHPPEAGLYRPGTSIWPVVCAGLPLARPVGSPWGFRSLSSLNPLGLSREGRGVSGEGCLGRLGGHGPPPPTGMGCSLSPSSFPWASAGAVAPCLPPGEVGSRRGACAPALARRATLCGWSSSRYPSRPAPPPPFPPQPSKCSPGAAVPGAPNRYSGRHRPCADRSGAQAPGGGGGGRAQPAAGGGGATVPASRDPGRLAPAPVSQSPPPPPVRRRAAA